MLHIVFGANLARDIVVADHVLLHIQVKGPAEPGGELHHPLIGRGGILPRLVRVADLDGDGIGIALIGGVGHLRQGHAGDDLPLQAHHEVGAG